MNQLVAKGNDPRCIAEKFSKRGIVPDCLGESFSDNFKLALHTGSKLRIFVITGKSLTAGECVNEIACFCTIEKIFFRFMRWISE
jgi:hypothetical protein